MQPRVCGYCREWLLDRPDHVTETMRVTPGIDLDAVRRMRRYLFVLAALVACDSAEEPLPDDESPADPAKDDLPGYKVTGQHAWYLAGDALTAGQDHLELSAATPAATHYVDLFMDGKYVKRAHRAAGVFKFSIDLKTTAIGAHKVLLAADGSHTAFSSVRFQRSYPLYVAVSNDWDTSDHGDDKLERQDRLHAGHPHLVITHFVGPYTFTDTTVAPTRVQYLVDWLKKYRDTAGDEIGLHVHPYCNFVTAAGVTCRTSPSFAKASDATGYTVVLSSYTQAELEKMFLKAASLFQAHGLARPTSFRAGGWTAQLHVIKALGTAGHVADSSGCNWARLEEWQNVAGAQLYQWNQANWGPIDETSQPYYPSTTDILADAAPHLPVLEVPDNGALVDYVTAAEMIAMFKKNFAGAALPEVRVYSIGYHPVDFSEEFFNRIDGALTEIDKHLAADDRGPVIYARVSDLTKVFPKP
ncbi:MAG: hypothetical protein JWO36_7154 [Myxococcales bacterium]|nr:hypothetical protein [Myxococcales bacterium]